VAETLTLLSRKSDLAVLQAESVRRALIAHRPDLEVVLTSRASAGDRDPRLALPDAADKGLFTADLSSALLDGTADAVVHSWKDLPLDDRPDTVVAGTLERADPRDVLLVRRDVVDSRPVTLRVLTSSPRRAWQVQQALAPLLPWSVSTIDVRPVRGNVPTRLDKLLAREGDGLIVAKAALDRLLSDLAPVDVASRVRDAVGRCAWMVLPVREFPTAPAQGALAIEVSAARADLLETVRAITHPATATAATAERAVLARHGGGCHQAIGVTVLVRPFGQLCSIRGQPSGGGEVGEWTLSRSQTLPPGTTPARIWPRPEERTGARRRPLEVRLPVHDGGYWIARADAAPSGFAPGPAQPVWAAGTRTWRKLARRGIWVNGCADGLGDLEPPRIDALAGSPVAWLRLTHRDADGTNAFATYVVDDALPSDLATRTHFFWTSGHLFRQALARYPALREAWHGSGPGRTARAIDEMLGQSPRVSIWLDYEQWHTHLTQ
jgi:hydroxymethylbilane synthase